ncbi:hypothetical protein JXC34_03920 [Candidatus Woesearchaeota archaeon]|nr:hypothetical protein [Candidatus Woesearchaeota archaeon]
MVEEKRVEEVDISRKTIVVLVILTVLVSLVSTFTVISEVSKVRVAPQPSINADEAQVTLNILPPRGSEPKEPQVATGKVVLNIEKPV